MLKELRANASTSFVNFMLAIIASYWVTIFHDIEINNNLSYIDLMRANSMFLTSNLVLLLLAAMSLYNIYTVININTKHIPKLQTILATLPEGREVRQVKDTFADLHDYFQIADVAEGDEVKELIVKPIKINTYVVSVRNISFSLKFNEGKYLSYAHEEGDRE